MKMNFPTDEKYLEFVHSLDKYRLRLSNGNCGIYAFALKEVFDEGLLFNIGDFSHVLLERDGKFYDGERIYKSLDDLAINSHWSHYYEEDYDHYELEEEDPEDAYYRIKTNTGCDRDKDFFINLIKEKFESGDFTPNDEYNSDDDDNDDYNPKAYNPED